MLDTLMIPLERSERLQAKTPAHDTPRFLLRLMHGCIFVLVVLLANAIVTADDWPQINGPNRNGVAENETLLVQWPADGLKEVWSHPVGQGNAGPVVVGEKLIIFHRPGRNYLVEALNSSTGKLIWNKELATEYNGGMDGDRGPKCVPLVHDGLIYLHGAGGVVFCLKLEDGTVVWQKNVAKEYKSRQGFFGVGSTPIVADGKLIVNAGGRDASIVALDLKTGTEAWKAFRDDASYSSPIEIKLAGQSVVVFVTRMNLLGLNSADGQVRFQTPFGKSGPTVNAAMPVAVDLGGKEFLFVTASYGVGAQWLELTDDGLEKVWGNDTSYSSQYSTPVFVDGSLFGTAGREDFKNGSYHCIDATNGNVRWKHDKFPVGHSLLVGKQILVLDSSGGFHVIEADDSKFKRLYQTRLFDSESRAMPAIANGLLYARSNASSGPSGGRPVPRRGGGTGELVCVEVGKRN